MTFHRLATRTLPRAALTCRRLLLPFTEKRPAAIILPSIALRQFSAPAQTISNPAMMCRQCEQTQDHSACTTVGVCGKTAETSVSCIMYHGVKSVAFAYDQLFLIKYMIHVI